MVRRAWPAASERRFQEDLCDELKYIRNALYGLETNIHIPDLARQHEKEIAPFARPIASSPSKRTPGPKRRKYLGNNASSRKKAGKLLRG